MKKINATFHNQIQSKAGLLCIADISGFTHFLRNADLVHYGDIAKYQLAGFRKLYGQSVVKVHRLLKGAV